MNFKPIREYNKMLTNTKRIYIPDDHDDLTDMIAEMKAIDDVYEVDGVLYNGIGHYEESQKQIAKNLGLFVE